MSEAPLPAWAHRSGALSLRFPRAPAERSPALERSLLAEAPSHYCWAYDERRLDLLEACFTEDAVWEGTVGARHRVGPMSGRARILDWLSEFWPHQHHQPRHVLLNTVVERLAGDEAETVSYLLLSTARRGKVRISTTGFYRLSLRRAPDRWRIARMFAGFDAPFWPVALARLGEEGRRRHGLAGGEQP